jgi:hypothetical protein
VVALIEPGMVWIGRGKDAQNIKWFASIHYDQLDNAAGSTGTYVNGKEKPDNNGYSWHIPAQYTNGAHRGPGELLYIGLAADAVDTFDTSDNVITRLAEALIDGNEPLPPGVQPPVRQWQLGDRVTSVPDGGFADDGTTVIGIITPNMAFPALPPGRYGKLTGFISLAIYDDTA